MHGIREMEDVFADEIAAMTDRRNLLRDHFAGLAMQGAMVNTHGLGNISKDDRTAMLDGAAVIFYEVADAMLRAREAGQ